MLIKARSQLPARLALLAFVAVLFLAVPSLPVRAADTLRLAIGAADNWENQPAFLGQQVGIFKKRDLSLDLFFTQGSGETLQAVIAGSADIGIGVGTYSAMSAFQKGAPVRIIANGTTGAHDLYWYVHAGSPIQSLADGVGKTIAFSTHGSSTHAIVLGLIKQSGVPLKAVGTGTPANTFTAVMSGQIDIGWSSPPLGVESLQTGRTRLIARGSDLKSVREQTVRVVIVNADVLARKPDAVKRFVESYSETVQWMYCDDAALKFYAEKVRVSLEIAKRSRDEFYPEENLLPNRLSGVDDAMNEAIASKFLSQPLTQQQLGELFQYQISPTQKRESTCYQMPNAR